MSSFDKQYLSANPRSYAVNTEQQQQPFSGSKKKFGKNLNKLTKPPPPPPNASLSNSRRDSSGKGSSNQGLLLLSTKRGSSAVNASGGSSISPSSNLLSKLSGGTPSLKIVGSTTVGVDNVATAGWKTTPAASTTSTPAVEVTSSSNSLPWRIAGEKSQTDNQAVGMSSGNDQPQGASVLPVPQREESIVHTDNESEIFVSETSNNLRQIETLQSDDTKTDEKSETLSESEVHMKPVSRVAKEILQDLASDEEPKMSTAERIRTQRRLKTLEEKQPIAPSVSLLSHPNSLPSSSRPGKKATSSTPHPSSVPTPILAPHVGRSSAARHSERSIILEPLNRPRAGDGNRVGTGNNGGDGNGHQRNKAAAETPENDTSSRTYSSLLGGSNLSKLSTGDDIDQQENLFAVKEERSPLSSMYQQSNPGSSTNAAQQLYNPCRGHDLQQANPTGNSRVEIVQSAVDTSQAVIHLSSYEDQDRGERSRASSGPRMLFDPKSGSLVEARPRESRRVKDKASDEKKSTYVLDKGKVKVERKGKSTRSSDRDKEKQLGQVKCGKDDGTQTLKHNESISGLVTELPYANEGDRKNSSKKQQRRDVPRNTVELNRGVKVNHSGHGRDSLNELLETEKSNNISLSPQNKKGIHSQSNNSVNSATPRKVADLLKKEESIKVTLNGSGEYSTVRGKIPDTLASAKHQDKRNGQGPKKSGGKRGENVATRPPQHIEGLKSHRRNEMQRKDRRATVVGKSADKDYAKGRLDASTKAVTQKFDYDFNIDDDLLLADNPDSPTLKATADAWRPSEAALRAAAAAAKSSMAAAPNSVSYKRNANDDEDSESDIPVSSKVFFSVKLE